MKNFLIKAKVVWLLLMTLSLVSMEAQDYWPDQIWVKLNSHLLDHIWTEAGNYEINVDPSTLQNGIYLYTLESNGLVQSKKWMIAK